MYNPDTEVLFPLRAIPNLITQRGMEWTDLVNNITAKNVDYVDQLAFSWMMVQLCSCVSCNADSFRAMRGCTQCSSQTLRRYRGDDKDLLQEFTSARKDVEEYLLKVAKKVN